MSGERVQRRLAAILAADVVGYSRLMEIDEAGTLARLKALRRAVVEPSIARHAGRMVKLMGDGALVEFASAVDAATCALEIQKLAPGHDANSADEKRIQFRIGINVGDVIVDEDDIYGDGVNVASRIEALAEPGAVYISRAVADQVRDKIPVPVVSRGSYMVKGIARPIEIFCLGRGGAGQSPDIGVTAGKSKPGPTATEKTSIAVLAFTNVSGDPDQEYFSDGISEDIITDLAKLSDLHVIARNSSFVYKASLVPIRDVAAALGVRYVLEGSVRKAGNRIRVTAQLIDATTSGHAWAERFDRDLTDIFAVQDELTQKIVAALKVNLTTSERDRLAGRRVADLAAYSYFLRGREQRWILTRAGNMNVRTLMAKVIEIDPDHAAAYALMACSHVNDYANGWAADPDAALATSLDLARRAVAMDDEEPECHVALGMALLFAGDLDKAIDAAERCIALKPSAADVRLVLARAQIFSGRAAEAVGTLDAYMQLDPLFPEIVLHFLAEARFELGEFDLALDAVRRRMARNPESATAHALLASICGHLGRTEEGRAAWAEVLRIEPGFSIEQRRRVLPFKNPADFERRVEGLRRLGLDV